MAPSESPLYALAVSAVSDSDAVTSAREAAAEHGLHPAGYLTGTLLTGLAAQGERAAAVAVTATGGVDGQYILTGLGEHGVLSIIEPNTDYQQLAETSLRAAGFPSPKRVRFLTANPPVALSRLAKGSYDLVYLAAQPADRKVLIEHALPLLKPGGCVVIANSLLDGTIADSSRRDRNTVSARECEVWLDDQEHLIATRLPLDGGVTIVTT